MPETGEELSSIDQREYLVHLKSLHHVFFVSQEADPATIRPLAVLERAFSFVMDKYRLNQEGSYICDQLRSIRQDLMVQAIRNDFTVLVYEANARISLVMVGQRLSLSSIPCRRFLRQGDREQFNQCQTQLEVLYDSGCNATHLNEFLMYRLLYSLLLNDYKSRCPLDDELDIHAFRF